ncbi:hypothetical protein JYK04_04643 [Streptomyces nojiriensis]|nr:hypothetical protein JYK04_04643 [Streptomyces nojiriensis]
MQVSKRAAHRDSGAAWSSRASEMATEITVELTISSGGSHGCRWMKAVTLGRTLRQNGRAAPVLPFTCGPRPAHHAFPLRRPPPSRPSCGLCTMAMTLVSGSCWQPWSTSPTPRFSSTCGSGFANDRSDGQALRNRRVTSAGLAAPPCRGRPRDRHGTLRAADPFGRALLTHPVGSRPPGLHVAAGGRSCSRNAALGGNQYLSPRSESLMDPAGRVFPHSTRWRYLTHTNRCSVLLSVSVAVLVPKNFKRSSRPPRHIRVLHISGHFPAGHHRGDTVSVWCGCWCTAPKEI